MKDNTVTELIDAWAEFHEAAKAFLEDPFNLEKTERAEKATDRLEAAADAARADGYKPMEVISNE